MDTRGAGTAWLFLEFVLLAPALLAVATFVFRRWIFQAFAMFPEDVYQGAVAFPFMGAVVGAVVAFGVSDFFHRDVWPGAGYVFAGLGIAAYAGGVAAKDRAKAEQMPLDPFSVASWRRDVDYLSRLRRLSGEDRREFAQRARELADRGRRACEEARRHQFGAYWRRRRRRVRVWAYAWLAAGVYVAANQALVMHSPWYLAASLAGGSVVLMVWFSWYDERMVKTTEGNAQIEASELIEQWLDRLPDAPVPSCWQRVAMLIFPRRAASR
jgi:hypothetical protein